MYNAKDDVYIRISKVLISLYIVYNTSLVYVGFFVPRLSILILAGSVLSLFIYFINNGLYVNMNYDWLLLLLFFVVSSITGQFVAVNYQYLNNTIAFLAESLIVGFIIIEISIISDSNLFVSKSVALATTIIAIRFLTGNVVYIEGRATISYDLNVNAFGVYMMFGCWCMLRNLISEKHLATSLVVSLLVSSYYTYIIIQSGSRKASISLLLIVISCIFIFWVLALTKRTVGYAIFVVLVVIIFFAVIYLLFGEQFLEKGAILQERLEDSETLVSGYNIRLDLALDALNCFKNNIICGVGLSNSPFHSAYGMYSHNTYAEALACTGILGSIPLFCVLVEITLKHLLWLQLNNNHDRYFLLKLFDSLLLIIFLFVCSGQIFFYNERLMIILFLIICNPLIGSGGKNDKIHIKKRSKYILLS